MMNVYEGTVNATVLLVGGPKDGETQAVGRVLPVYKVDVWSRPVSAGDLVCSQHLTIYEYRWSPVRFGGWDTGFYLGEGMTGADGFARLLAHYRPEKEKVSREELLRALRKLYEECSEHNIDYQHRTSPEFLAEVFQLLRQSAGGK